MIHLEVEGGGGTQNSVSGQTWWLTKGKVLRQKLFISEDKTFLPGTEIQWDSSAKQEEMSSKYVGRSCLVYEYRVYM